MDPNTHKDEKLKKEVMRRKAQLEDEAKKKGIGEEPEQSHVNPCKRSSISR